MGSVWDDLDAIFRRLEREVQELANEVERSLKRRGEDGERRRVVYGFSIIIPPGGGPPIVRRFGNLLLGNRDERVPLLDVFSDAKRGEVVVVAELPGADPEDISLKLLDATTIEISAPGYSATVNLPAEVEKEGHRATFKNGVLEIRLKAKRPKEKEKEGSEIPIEVL